MSWRARVPDGSGHRAELSARVEGRGGRGAVVLSEASGRFSFGLTAGEIHARDLFALPLEVASSVGGGAWLLVAAARDLALRSSGGGSRPAGVRPQEGSGSADAPLLRLKMTEAPAQGPAAQRSDTRIGSARVAGNVAARVRGAPIHRLVDDAPLALGKRSQCSDHRRAVIDELEALVAGAENLG